MIPDHEFYPSACTFCPLVTNQFRQLVKDRDPQGHQRAVEIDRQLRKGDAVAARLMNGELYIHRSLKPLSKVDFKENHGQVSLFGENLFCSPEGFCGH